MKVVFWGTYDLGKPRNRILLRGLRENNIDLIECHKQVWEGVEDKSQIQGLSAKITFLLKWLFSYPALLFRYLTLPRHDVVIVGYLGQLDVLVLWPFAKLRRARVVWDAFLSLHDTVVSDRRLISEKGVLSRILYRWEWLACRAADKVILDTDAHRELFIEKFGLKRENTGAVFVGVEPEKFKLTGRKNPPVQADTLHILFYGQFIPLHGIPYIIEAARLLENEPVQFTIVGTGQDSSRVEAMMSKVPLENISFIRWVNYDNLVELILQADICLGIFGDSDKAGRVIPNKVFQIIQTGKPLITRDSAAIRELLSPAMEGIYLVKPASPENIAEVVKQIMSSPRDSRDTCFHHELWGIISPRDIGRKLIELFP